jgi:hypothetical protein
MLGISMTSKVLYWFLFVVTWIFMTAYMDKLPGLISMNQSPLFILPVILSVIALPLVLRRIYIFMQSKSATPPPLGKLSVFFLGVLAAMIFIVYGTKIIPPLRPLAFGAGILKLFFPIPLVLAYISCELLSFRKAPYSAVTPTVDASELTNGIDILKAKAEDTKRPISITVVCAIGLFTALSTIPLFFTSIPQQIGAWYPPYLALSSVVGLVCIGGLWMMKKWAAYAYLGFLVLNQTVPLATGVWSVMSMVATAIVVFVVWTNVARMS